MIEVNDSHCAEDILIQDLEAIAEDDIGRDLYNIFRQGTDTQTLVQVLGRSLEQALGEDMDFPDSFFAFQYGSVDLIQRIIKDLQSQHSAWKVPSFRRGTSPDITQFQIQKRILALMLAHSQNEHLQYIAESLWGKNVIHPSHDTEFTLQTAIEEYSESPGSCLQAINALGTDTQLKVHTYLTSLNHLPNEPSDEDISARVLKLRNNSNGNQCDELNLWHEARTMLLLEQFEALKERYPSDTLLQAWKPEFVRPRQGDIDTTIRWLIRRDLVETLAIERMNFSIPWSEDDFLDHLGQRNRIGMVAERDHSIVGFMIYELHKSKLHILNFAVHPTYQRARIGTTMFRKLKDKITQQSRKEIILQTSVRNIPSWQFFLNQGCTITHVKNCYFPTGEEETFTLQYLIDEVPSNQLTTIISEALGIDRKDFDTEDENENDSSLPKMQTVLGATYNNPQAKMKVFDAFQRWIHRPTQRILEAIIQQCFDTLTRIQEVSQENIRGSDIAISKKGNHELRDLKSVLRTKERRAELDVLRQSGNLAALDSKERAIIYDTFSEGLKFPFSPSSHSYQPLFKKNTPNTILDNQSLSCFAGPWMAASFLIESGIPANQIFYCDDVVWPNQQFFGDHGSLLIRTSNNKLIMIDIGHAKSSESVKTSYARGEKKQDEFKSLLKCETSEPVRIHFDHAQRESHSLPVSMQVLPLLEGFASIHMFNIGLQFSSENRHQEAQLSYELGLSINPQCAYILSHLGITYFEQGDREKAKMYLEKALQEDSRHLFAHFSMGELYLSQGDKKKARKCFRVVDKDRRTIYGDNGRLKAKARSYLLESA